MHTPQPEIRALKQIILNAIAVVDGYVGPPDAACAPQSIGVQLDSGRACICIRAVLRPGGDIPAIVAAMAASVSAALQEQAGIEVRILRVKAVKAAARDNI